MAKSKNDLKRCCATCQYLGMDSEEEESCAVLYEGPIPKHAENTVCDLWTPSIEKTASNAFPSLLSVNYRLVELNGKKQKP